MNADWHKDGCRIQEVQNTMKKQLFHIYSRISPALAAVCGLTMQALALSPNTGDQRGQTMGIFVAVLVVSAVVIAVMLALGGKKKGKKPPKK